MLSCLVSEGGPEKTRKNPLLLATAGFFVSSKSAEYYKRGSKAGRLSAGAELLSIRSLFILGKLKNIILIPRIVKVSCHEFSALV